MKKVWARKSGKNNNFYKVWFIGLYVKKKLITILTLGMILCNCAPFFVIGGGERPKEKQIKYEKFTKGDTLYLKISEEYK